MTSLPKKIFFFLKIKIFFSGYHEDVQGALNEDSAKSRRQAEFHQTLQMSHFLRFRFLTGLFESAAVDQGKAPADSIKQANTS